MLKYDLLIDGKFIPANSNDRKDIINPATGELLAQVSMADIDDVNLAVHSAANAFYNGPWRKINSRERTKLLLKLASLIRENSEELARLESQNVGKPIR